MDTVGQPPHPPAGVDHQVERTEFQEFHEPACPKFVDAVQVRARHGAQRIGVDGNVKTTIAAEPDSHLVGGETCIG